MKVRKNAPGQKPDYPSQRQFAECKRTLGIAAIGLSTMAGAAAAGDPVFEEGGVIHVEPQQAAPAKPATNATPKQTEPVRLPGRIAVSPAAPAAPKQGATNAPACTSYAVKPGDTLSALAERFLGSSKRWEEIVAANPGLKPEALKVGQTLAIPAAAPSDTERPRLKGKMPIEGR